MMWILESPIPILAMGGMSFAIASAVLVHTGRRLFLSGLIAIPVITAFFLLLEHVIVTPREEVELMLHNLASDIQDDDHVAVLSHISDLSVGLKSKAERILKRIQVDKAVVKRNLRVTVFSRQHPPVAEARFNGVIVASDRYGALQERPYPRFFVVRLRKEAGQWRVRTYQDHPPHKRP